MSSSSTSGVNALDLPRSMRNMLDHASNNKNINLQRWAASCLKKLILEDERRACLAVNDVAAIIRRNLGYQAVGITKHEPDERTDSEAGSQHTNAT